MSASPNVDDSQSEHPNVLASATADKKCVDFVSHLPWEIVKCNIVPRILGEGRPVFRLHRPCPYLDARPMRSGGIDKRIRTVAPYIKTLSMTWYNDKSMGIHLKCDTLVALTKLTIRGSQGALLQLLDISPNLTHMDIFYVADIDTRLSIFELLDRCPKLIRLSLLLPGNAIMDTTTTRLGRTYDTITHLQAICEDHNKNGTFSPLIQRLPNLRLLSLKYLSSLPAWGIRQHQCQKLQQLYMSSPTMTYDVHDEVQCEDESPGLRVLSFDGRYDMGYIANIMIRHSATLESLVFQEHTYFNTSTTRSWANRDIQFNQLRSLSYENGTQRAFIDFMNWIIDHAPNLRSVETIHGAMQRHHLNSTLRERPLQRIGFYSTYTEQPSEHQFIQHHVQLGAGSHLQEIKCTFYDYILNDSWVALIPRLTELKTIELCFHDDAEVDGLDAFIQQVANGCIGLEKVIMKAFEFPYHYDWIRPLAEHPNLQELIIEKEDDTSANLMLGVNHDIPYDLLIALESFTHLKTLHLKYDISNWDRVFALKRKVPTLMYTERYDPI